MKLGEKILQELDPIGNGDTLTKWLAHHIADLMTQADRARSEGEATSAAEQCQRAILDLWAHRTAWPNGWPPPGARRMAEALNSIEEPWFGFRQDNGPSSLQRLHLQVLQALADEGTKGEPIHAEQEWLEAHEQLLHLDERAMLALYVGRDDRGATPAEERRTEQPGTANSHTDDPTSPAPQIRRVAYLADRYREVVESLLTDDSNQNPPKLR